MNILKIKISKLYLIALMKQIRRIKIYLINSKTIRKFYSIIKIPFNIL